MRRQGESCADSPTDHGFICLSDQLSQIHGTLLGADASVISYGTASVRGVSGKDTGSPGAPAAAAGCGTEPHSCMTFN